MVDNAALWFTPAGMELLVKQLYLARDLTL